MLRARRLLRLLLAIPVLATAAPAAAGDAVVFVTFPSPDAAWSRGFGAALTSTWFATIGLEAEAVRIPLEGSTGTMTSFTGSVLLAPPIGPFVPYGGVGFGVYRQSADEAGETSTVGVFILGAKAKLGVLVVKGDYRSLKLAGDPLLPMDRRLSIGAGIAF